MIWSNTIFFHLCLLLVKRKRISRCFIFFFSRLFIFVIWSRYRKNRLSRVRSGLRGSSWRDARASFSVWNAFGHSATKTRYFRVREWSQKWSKHHLSRATTPTIKSPYHKVITPLCQCHSDTPVKSRADLNNRRNRPLWANNSRQFHLS